jgi:DHA2 family multidrug resistance protein
MGIGGLQMMLDRGQDKDWFSSNEIIVEGILAGLGIYLFVVHMITAKKPFITPSIFLNRNFATSLVMMFAVGMVLLASSALLAPFLQVLSGYPVATAGLTLAPRGLGTMLAMIISGRLSTKVDPRKLMGIGVLLLGWSLWNSTTWTQDVPEWTIIVNIMVQGAGLGFVFIPLQVIAFATLDPRLRTDGTSLLSLFRNVGSAIGVSVTSSLLAHNTQVVHAELGAGITPFNRALQGGGAVSRMLDPATAHGAVALDGMINQQATLIGYIDDFKLMMVTTLPTILLLFLMRRPSRLAAPPADAHAAMD